jgi:hypothetical protein
MFLGTHPILHLKLRRQGSVRYLCQRLLRLRDNRHGYVEIYTHKGIMGGVPSRRCLHSNSLLIILLYVISSACSFFFFDSLAFGPDPDRSASLALSILEFFFPCSGDGLDWNSPPSDTLFECALVPL